MQDQSFLASAGSTLALAAALMIGARAEAQTIAGYMPDESAPHEGTWLEWPHHHTYGVTYRNRLDATWVNMTRELVPSEKVHIIAYDTTERTRITNLLTAGSVSLANVDFLLRANNDCWVRDNGPVFVHSPSGQLNLTDWGFNGWGFDTPYLLDDTVPVAVATSLGVPRVDLAATVLEGGAIEVDGGGVLMATRSSILEPMRNPGLTQAQLESVLTTNLGVTKFIWLNGAPGGQLDITDMHIDGFARFGTPGTIVTLSSADLAYWGLSAADVSTLYGATDIAGTPYTFVTLPLTAANVVTTYGFNIGFKGSYVNYYVANTVVLVPTYNDANDTPAKNIVQQLYPSRTVVGIDVRNLYRDGGMVHCVTQQQPVVLPANAMSFCAGDGTGNACPCSNVGGAGRGCASFVNPTGARLSALGIASVSNDKLVLSATGMPDSFALYLQGSAQAAFGLGTVFGDGLLCVGGSIVRLGLVLNFGGMSQHPAADGLLISIQGAVPASGGLRSYQCWYRSAEAYCTSATFNLSQGIAVDWTP